MTAHSARDVRAEEERALAMVLPVVDRLRQTIEAENQGLVSRARIDYLAFSQRKSQGLMELSRLRPALDGLRRNPRARAAIADLSGKLDINYRLLGLQLKAAKTISSLVARAIRDGQSDGTYSPHPWKEYDL